MKHYIYVGDINRQRLFYCTESREIYLEPQNRATGVMRWLPSICVAAGCLGMAVLRRIDGYYVPGHMGYFVLLSTVAGVIAAYFLAGHVRKAEHNGFAGLSPMKGIRQEELQNVSRRAGVISLHYAAAKLFMVLLVLFLPFVIRGTGSLFCVICYPLCWMGLGYLCFYFNPGKRRRAIKEFRECYIRK